MIINVPNIGPVEIVNWPEFRKKVLFLMGEGLIQAIQDEAMMMGLFQNGRYIRGFNHYVDQKGVLNIDNDVSYAPYLEYGTFEYFNVFGIDSFPESVIKKKNLTMKARENLPKGMNPFAPIRRVLYNPAKVSKIVNEWVK